MSAEDENPSEYRPPRLLTSPKDPTRKEREEHEGMGHAIYRSWCKHCVRNRGRASPHQADPTQAYNKPQIGADYWFMGGADGNRESLPVLVVYERTHRCLYADVVPQKGVTDLVVEQIIRDLDAMGHQDGLGEPRDRAFQRGEAPLAR